MKIGVDASCWANKRGYGRYTRELLQALVALDKDNDYRFFLDSATARQSVALTIPTERPRLIANQATRRSCSPNRNAATAQRVETTGIPMANTHTGKNCPDGNGNHRRRGKTTRKRTNTTAIPL